MNVFKGWSALEKYFFWMDMIDAVYDDGIYGCYLSYLSCYVKQQEDLCPRKCQLRPLPLRF